MASLDSVSMHHHRTERVLIETQRHRISGTLTLPRDGYRSRLSDYLNGAELNFVSLTNVRVEPVDGSSEGSDHDFLAVARGHIVLASSLD